MVAVVAAVPTTRPLERLVAKVEPAGSYIRRTYHSVEVVAVVVLLAQQETLEPSAHHLAPEPVESHLPTAVEVALVVMGQPVPHRRLALLQVVVVVATTRRPEA